MTGGALEEWARVRPDPKPRLTREGAASAAHAPVRAAAPTPNECSTARRPVCSAAGRLDEAHVTARRVAAEDGRGRTAWWQVCILTELIRAHKRIT